MEKIRAKGDFFFSFFFQEAPSEESRVVIEILFDLNYGF